MQRTSVHLLWLAAMMAGGSAMASAQPSKCPLSSPPKSAMGWSDGGEANTLRGRILNTQTSEALPGATVRLFAGGFADWPDSAIAKQRTGAYHALTDSAGVFKIPGIMGGPYMLIVGALGFRYLRDTVTIGTDGLTLVAALGGYPRDKACVFEARPPAT